MVAEIIGSEAWRPNGTYFGGPNPYGTWNPAAASIGVAGTGVVGTNGIIGASRVGGYNPFGGYNPYNPMGGFPSVWGNVGGAYMDPAYMQMRKKMGLGMGISRASEYHPETMDLVAEEGIKAAAKDVCNAIRRDKWYNFQDFDEEEIAKRWGNLADAVRKCREYQEVYEGKRRALIDQGKSEEEASSEAREFSRDTLYALMRTKYEKCIGISIDDDIEKHNDYWVGNEQACSELIAQLRAKSI